MSFIEELKREIEESVNEAWKNERKFKRGEVYECTFCNTTGSEQSGKRPVMIIQNNIGNRFSSTVIVAVMTTKRKNSNYPMHVNLLKRVHNDFKDDSTILFEQIHTVEKSRLERFITDLSKNHHVMNEVDKAILLSLGISI
jgi:mRNA interferase MazF